MRYKLRTDYRTRRASLLPRFTVSTYDNLEVALATAREDVRWGNTIRAVVTDQFEGGVLFNEEGATPLLDT